MDNQKMSYDNAHDFFSFAQLESLCTDLRNGRNEIAHKDDELRTIHRTLSRLWSDEKWKEFNDVVTSLFSLNTEALELLGKEVVKISTYVESLRSALNMEVKQ